MLELAASARVQTSLPLAKPLNIWAGSKPPPPPQPPRPPPRCRKPPPPSPNPPAGGPPPPPGPWPQPDSARTSIAARPTTHAVFMMQRYLGRRNLTIYL